MDDKENWFTYFEATKTKPPSETAINAMKQFDTNKGFVIDLGCGAGIDSLFFLKNGWNVMAIDSQTDFVQQLKEGLNKEEKNRFYIRNMQFEKMELPESVKCIIANFSLPFCRPECFMAMWENIVDSLEDDGIFSGVFFGDKDKWAEGMSDELTFLTKEQVLYLFQDFEILLFSEEEFDGTCCGEDGRAIPKHWHIFKVVSKKSANIKYSDRNLGN